MGMLLIGLVGLEAPSIADFSKVRDLFKLLAVGLVSELVLDMSIDLGRCLICVGLVGSFVVVGLGLRVVSLGIRVVGFVVLVGGTVVTLLAETLRFSAVDDKQMNIISVRQFICS